MHHAYSNQGPFRKQNILGCSICAFTLLAMLMAALLPTAGARAQAGETQTSTAQSPVTATSVALDESGNIYVAGDKTGFATYAAKLTSDGTHVWDTSFGGTAATYPARIALDTIGNVYVAGLSDATWGSPIRAYYSGSLQDAYVARLTTAGELLA